MSESKSKSQSPIFDIRHDEYVVSNTLIKDQIQPGRVGKVIAMRVQEGRANYLIKWQGRSWPCAAWRDEIERKS